MKKSGFTHVFQGRNGRMVETGFNVRSWSLNSTKLEQLAKKESVLETKKYTIVL